MIAQSSVATILATTDKLGTVAPFKLADATRVDHLVDVDNVADIEQYSRLDIQLHRVPAADASHNVERITVRF